MYFFNTKFEFDEIGDGTDVILINTEINEIEWVFHLNHCYEQGFFSSLLSVSFPESSRRLVLGFYVFYLFKSL